jgi:hypothetical protein
MTPVPVPPAPDADGPQPARALERDAFDVIVAITDEMDAEWSRILDDDPDAHPKHAQFAERIRYALYTAGYGPIERRRAQADEYERLSKGYRAWGESIPPKVPGDGRHFDNRTGFLKDADEYAAKAAAIRAALAD